MGADCACEEMLVQSYHLSFTFPLKLTAVMNESHRLMRSYIKSDKEAERETSSLALFPVLCLNLHFPLCAGLQAINEI